MNERYVSIADSLDKAWQQVADLSRKYAHAEDHYLSSGYQEAEVRKDFLDKFFEALGWDVNHEREHDPWRQEVKIEQSDKKTRRRADYVFSLAPHYKRIRFLVEAKRPQLNIVTPDNCFQVIRYSWPKGLPIAVLTDYRSLNILDTRFRPNINTAESRVIHTWYHEEYLDREKFKEIYWLLSREAVSNGSIENFAKNELPVPEAAIKQYTLFPGEAREFDDDFLQNLDLWRKSLAMAFKHSNAELNGAQLTECVQRTLDRLIFIRFLEDKLIEPDRIIEKYGTTKKTHWVDFIDSCERLDHIYNGIVFKHHPILDDRKLSPHGAVFTDICDELSDQHSPYNFDSIPIEILGRIYERFLGKVVVISKTKVDIVDKPDVRKAGGVYYTPDYIVAYIVDHTLGLQLRGMKPDQILKTRIIDTACGSGSFLIGAFSYLLHVMSDYWTRNTALAKKGIIDIKDGTPLLSLNYKREILLKCIYGVDIDPQAVEVAQLSLYLKLLDDETTYSARHQQLEMGAALLPSLSANVINGNSLVDSDSSSGDLFAKEKSSKIKALDFKLAFKHVFAQGGFDFVIGNPPYIKEYTNKDAFEHVRNSPYYEGKMDIWYLFACRAVDLLKDKSGTLGYIATNNWVTNAGAKKLRSKIVRDTRIVELIDFGDYKVFRDAGIQTMILITTKCAIPKSYKFDYRRLEGHNPTIREATALLDKVECKGCVYLSPSLDCNRKEGTPLTFSDDARELLLDKLEMHRSFTLEKDEVGVGIDVHQDYLSSEGAKKLGPGYRVGEGIFNITQSEKKALHLTKEELPLVKPFYTSAELGRYYGKSNNSLWVIYTDSRFKKASAMKPYPNLKRHLDRFRTIITSDNGPYGLHRARIEGLFLGDKIVSLRKTKVPCFTFTNFPCYVSQSYIVIKTARVNLLFLTALLNSNIVRFWLRYRGKMQGAHFQIDKAPLMSIPIHAPTETEQDVIASLVRKLLSVRQDEESASTDSERTRLGLLREQLENLIEEKIHILYELGEDELRLLRD